MAGLHGEYRHKLDAKGRLSLPAAFRKVLSDRLIVTLSPQSDCLYVFEEAAFDQWVESLFQREGGFDSSNAKHVRLRKGLNSRAKDVDMDASGRIGITAQQRSLTGLEKDVVLVGDSDHFEIWDAQRWDEFYSDIDFGSLFA